MKKCIDGCPCNPDKCKFYEDIEETCIAQDIINDYKLKLAAWVWWADKGSHIYNLREGWYSKRNDMVIMCSRKNGKIIMGTFVVEIKDKWNVPPDGSPRNLEPRFSTSTAAIVDIYLRKRGQLNDG